MDDKETKSEFPDFPPADFYCPAADHNNDETGCSNPDCFKHPTPRIEWQQFNEWIQDVWSKNGQ